MWTGAAKLGGPSQASKIGGVPRTYESGGTGTQDLARLLAFSYGQQPPPEGYTLDEDLSSANTRVLRDNQTGGPVVVHRGSATLGDWVQDGAIASGHGYLTPRYWKARSVTSKAEKKYGQPAEAVGHSLGGWLAENSGAKGSIQTYNKIVAKADMFKPVASNQTDYRTSKDVVSALAPTQTLAAGGKRVTIATDSWKTAHDLSHLTNYKNK